MKRIAEGVFFALMDALMLYPLAVVMHSGFGIALADLSLALAGICLCAHIVGRLCGKRRLWPGGLILAAFLAFLFATLGVSHITVIAGAMGAVAFMYCLWISVKPWQDVYRPAHMVAPLVLYLVGYFFLFLSVSQAYTYLWYGAFPYMCASLILANRRMVIQRASMRSGVAKRVIRQNLWMTVALVGLTVFLINISAIRQAIVSAFRALTLWILELLMGGEGEGSVNEGDAFGGDMDMSDLAGEAVTARFWEILSVIFTWLAIIAAAVLLLYGIYRLAKWLGPFLRRKLSMFAHAYMDSYEEESESLLSAGQLRDEFVNAFKKRLKKLLTPPPNWDKLTDEQRVRLAYLRTMQRARDVGVSPDTMTPAELLGNKRVRLTGSRDMFESAYYNARYAERAPSPDQVENAKAVYTGKESRSGLRQ